MHYKRVLAALRASGRDDPEVMADRDVLPGAWERALGSSMVALMVGEARHGAPLVSDVDLAHG